MPKVAAELRHLENEGIMCWPRIICYDAGDFLFIFFSTSQKTIVFKTQIAGTMQFGGKNTSSTQITGGKCCP